MELVVLGFFALSGRGQTLTDWIKTRRYGRGIATYANQQTLAANRMSASMIYQ
jgi:hypothetical protein